ncbi:MAG TPA: TonB-dependent receptor [Verrucomicrobiae bacterium]|nr:TonB-dependent receptor [Verrucomicrobiae bacterium]
MARRIVTAVAALILAFAPLAGYAGTTGTLRGRVLEAGSGAPVAGATIVAVSPSQRAQTTSDSAGNFSFISLDPDTYTISAAKAGYEPQSQPGIAIFADQGANVSLVMSKTLQTIAHTTSRSTQSLVHSGVTSDVYSVNPTGQKAAQALGGSGSMLQAYGAIASAPGVNIPSTQAGWYQGVYVRGGDIDQVAYEFDGLPVTRQSDLAPITTLTSLGNQEVQVYTGGTPASSNSSGLAGYINQVIKAGTSPGYADADLSTGGPAFYHEAKVEVSGATPDRVFSYYAGFAGTNQDLRYATQFNGAGEPLYFYPLWAPSGNPSFNIYGNGILDGSGGGAPNYGALFAPGPSYAQATNVDRENVVNLHLAIPHKNSPYRDDVQLLYIEGGINTWFYSSQNELGITDASVANHVGGFSYPIPYLTSTYYVGPLMQAPDPSKLATGSFPSQPSDESAIGPNQRDGSYNGYSIEKLQYQKNFNDRSYLRFLTYGEYSDWFISGPTSAQLPFGAELADYEVLDHTFGGGLIYSNQLSVQNLVTAQSTFMTQKLQTYNATFSSTDAGTSSLGTNNYLYDGGMYSSGLGTVLSSYIDKNGNCYNYQTGALWSCFDYRSQGGPLPGGAGINLTPGYAPAGSAAAKAGAHWVVTENGQSAQVDDVTPIFSSYSLTDLWQPNDKLTANLGVRLDHFAYATNDLESGYPARQFWFNAYNREHCGELGQSPTWLFNPGSGSFTSPSDCEADGYGAPMWNGTGPTAAGLTNVPAGLAVANVFQPRASFTYTLDPDTVLRGSYGKYARAEGSSYYQYNTYQQNLASFISQFYAFGYTTPDHSIYPDTSYNYDLSLEKHLKGTNVSFKLSPFYRSTKNQVEYKAIDALGGTLAGLNVGTQHSYGVEFSLQGGDFARDGFSYLLSYTYTDSKVHFSPINGQSVIDNLNEAIAQFNSYTHACAGVTASSPNWAACGSGHDAGNAAPTLLNSDASANAGQLQIPNPYYKEALEPLLDTNGWYSPYDTVPGPFSYSNGYEVPNVASLILNYKHRKLAITPSLHYVDGSFYGSPLVYPGYVPQFCSKQPAATPTTPAISCNNPDNFTADQSIFIPDPFTGNRFDGLGSLREPSQFTLNLQLSYDVTPRATVTATLNNLVNVCPQRGYAWDNPVTCTYSNLPSNVLPPSGNFLTDPPVQVKYPYGTFFNITEVGATSVLQPFNFFVDLSVKI